MDLRLKTILKLASQKTTKFMHTVALFYVKLALSLTYVAFTKVENEILVFSRNSY